MTVYLRHFLFLNLRKAKIIFRLALICLLEVVLPAGSVLSQTENLALGQWRVHLPFNKLISIAEGNGDIYCAGNDGMFIYSKDDGNISLLTRMEGLSDFGITQLRYNQAHHVLVVTYQNSNIDLIYDDKTIFNISEIYHANIIGSKTINHVDFNGPYAYISCGFGIVVIDLGRREIKDTYYLGSTGSEVAVYGTVIYGSEIFAATSIGIYRANAASPLLSFYTSWSKDTTLPDPDGQYNFIAPFGQKLVANNDSTSNLNNVLVYDGASWTYFFPGDNTVSTSIEYFGNHLVIVNGWSISAYNNQGIRTYYIDGGYPNFSPRFGFVDTDNIFWVADRNNGLTRNTTTGEHTLIYPNGPGASGVYALASKDSRLWVAGGYIEGNLLYNSYSKDGVYLFKNNLWKTYNKTTSDIELDTVAYFDFITVAIDPNDAEHAFFGSWGRGLFEFTAEGVQRIFNETNSSLVSFPGDYNIRVGGLSFDSQNNLWATNYTSPSPISVRRTNGTWQTYAPSSLQNTIPQGILCDSHDRKWIVLPWNGGLVVFDELNTFSHTSDEINDTHARKFTTAVGKGKLPSVNVQSIAEDREGQIWIGTDKGVAVLYSPDNVYSGNFDFSQVLIQQDGNYQYLLETEMVTAIAVDGANFKWFGTSSSGVFLMSPDGTLEVAHFTAENSPLLSNNILTIAIDQKSGEVFFGTDRGIVSFKAPAIEAGDDFENVYAYPNPVRPGYNGVIAIRGLVANSNLKITDITGNIVYETISLGGQAIWDGKNFKGERAQSGVYLVFCANDDGTKTFVTKLLFMH